MFMKSVYMFYTLITIVSANESCTVVTLSGLGPPDGTYISNSEYLGRPDFYRDDFFYNLFGSFDDNDASLWEISSFSTRYPTYHVLDNAQYPVDIQQQWVITAENHTQTTSDAWFECSTITTRPDASRHVIIFTLIPVFVVLIVLLHVYIRKRRLRVVTENCVVCKRRRERINSSMRRTIKPI